MQQVEDVPAVLRADLTAFVVDPLLAPPDELADAPIALTTVGGCVVHRDALVDA